MKENLSKINKPMQIIALMIGLSEIGFGIIAKNVNLPESIIWVMVLLPCVVVVLFFYILIFKPNNLYSPSDFKDQKDFLLLQGKVRNIEDNPFIAYAKLEEPSIRLFLSIYHIKDKSKDQKWKEIEEKFGKDDTTKALEVLNNLGWLSKSKKPYLETKSGQDTFNVLKEFIFGRLG